MSIPTRFDPALAVMVGLTFFSTGVAQTPPPAKGLAEWLTKRGFVEVPLTLNKMGLLDVKVEVEGLSMLMVLDTGANNINLDPASAKKAKLTVNKVEGKTSVVGGELETGQTTIEKLSVGRTTSPPAYSYVHDFAPMNAARKQFGDPPCDGVLGASVLIYWSAIIDYANLKLYLLDPERKSESPAELLKKAGYTETDLTLNKAGLLDVKVEADGTPLLLFLDTGARPAVSLDWSSAKRAKLVVERSKSKSSELGGSVERGTAKTQRLSVGKLTKPTDIDVLDFAPQHSSRKVLGAPPCDGTLGGGYLQKHSAIIDYSHERLYLLDPVRR